MKEFIRQPIAGFLRAFRLLDAADRILLTRDQKLNAPANAAFKAQHPAFVLPPDLLAFEAYNSTSAEHYQRFGLGIASSIGASINAHCAQDDGLRIMEWGCGPARVIRHIASTLNTRHSSIIGTDYNKETIEWCQAAIPGIEFIANEALPPIACADASLDAIYAISVFTHLSEHAQQVWMKEILRMLKPDGIFIFTTHGKSRLHKLIGSQRAAFEAGKLVTKGQYRVGKKHYLAYHPESYVKSELLDGFELLEFEPDGAENKIGQDKWVVRAKR